MNRLLSACVFVLWWCFCIVIEFVPIYTFDMTSNASMTDVVIFTSVAASVATTIALSESHKFYTTRCIFGSRPNGTR